MQLVEILSRACSHTQQSSAAGSCSQYSSILRKYRILSSLYSLTFHLVDLYTLYTPL